jgi:Putative zinc-finger
MNHNEAIKNKAVDKYLLGELAGPQREEFEEHFFCCTECAEGVQTGTMFADNLRAVLREKPHLARASAATRTSWWQRFFSPILVPAFAAAMLCLVYQNAVQIPTLRTQVRQASASRALPSFAVHAIARGESQVITLTGNMRFYNLYLDLPGESAGGYQCSIADANGTEQFSIPGCENQQSGTLYIRMNALQTAPGQYMLLVRSSVPGSQEIERYPFTVRNE